MQYTLTTAPDLSERWSKVHADEQTHDRIGNRATDEAIRAAADAKAAELATEREQLEKDIAVAARIITVERVAPKVWGRVVAENPPRPGDPYDARLGVNTDTFDGALMPLAITTVTDGNGEDVEWDWPTLAGAMSPGLYEQIISDVIRLHMERDAVPFSLPASQPSPGSARSSK